MTGMAKAKAPTYTRILASELEGGPRRAMTHTDRMRCAFPCGGLLMPAKHLGPLRYECDAWHHLWDYGRRGWELVKGQP